MSAEPSRRAWYMTAIQAALRAIDGPARVPEVMDWIRAQGLARPGDLETQLKTGGSRFEKEVRFARLMLERAGFLERPEPGVWALTETGAARDLSPQAAQDVFRALTGAATGLLSAERTYAAILAAARKGRFVTYGELGEASGVAWAKARLPLPQLLGRISQLAHARGWPLLSAIVVNREDVGTGRLGENALKGFIGAARDIGLDVGDDQEAFVRDQQARVFAWAPTAPNHMGLAGRADGADPEDQGLEAEAFPFPLPSVASVSERSVAYSTADIVDDGCFLPLAELDDMIERLKARKNIILQGPPGTGKTWLAKRLAYALLGEREGAADRMRVVQFHPSLAYEDFVRGWRPGSDGKLHLADGVLLQAVEAALSEPDRPFVLVIEEINRGDPAQVLGEMLTLLEAGKRRPEEALELAYPREKPGGERVHVPDNLHVIGTMNIADRSLALVDLALRRRFAFITLEPRLGEAWRRWVRDVGGLSETMAALVETRLLALNDDIAADRGLGKQFRIGHSYVTPLARVGDDGGRRWFDAVIETDILPLLDEYWHDQPDRASEAAARLTADLP